MDNLYLDTNIILDFLLNRTPFDFPATQLFEAIEQKKCKAFTSPLNLVHVHYQLRKQVDELETRAILTDILKIINVVATPQNVVNQAIPDMACGDFEDAVQYAISKNYPINYLITRNTKDFPQSKDLIICEAEMYLKNAK